MSSTSLKTLRVQNYTFRFKQGRNMYVWRITLFVILLLFYLTACQNPPVQNTPFTKGEKFYRARCGNCHILPSPKYYSLNTVLEQIEEHKLAKKISLNPEEEQSLIIYLTSLWNK